jgi:hypothetical protein
MLDFIADTAQGGIKLGGFTASSGTGCACPTIPTGCNIKICLYECNGVTPWPCGATITIYDAMTNAFLGSANTGVSGCVTFVIPTSESGRQIIIDVNPNSPVWATASYTATVLCGFPAMYFVVQPAASHLCCSGGSFPESMTLTDANGSHPFIFCPYAPIPGWQTCYEMMGVANTQVFTGTVGNCSWTCTPSSGSIAIGYAGVCTSVNGVPALAVTRSWYLFDCAPLYMYFGIFPGGPACTDGIYLGGSCPNAISYNGCVLTYIPDFSTATLPDLNPICVSPAFSGTLVHNTGANPLWPGDPVGGVIAIS